MKKKKNKKSEVERSPLNKMKNLGNGLIHFDNDKWTWTYPIPKDTKLPTGCGML